MKHPTDDTARRNAAIRAEATADRERMTATERIEQAARVRQFLRARGYLVEEVGMLGRRVTTWQ
jgi:hypothetical protein